MKLSFAGHSTFTCRNSWLKKGLDYAWEGGTFNNSAAMELGVGRNMVGAIRYWTRSFGLIENDLKYTQLARHIFNSKEGKDPYLEDIGTIWLLHYLLVTTASASIYNLVFNYFRKIRVEFTREQLLAFLESECRKIDLKYSVNSLKKDIAVFINNYLIPEKSKSIESDFFGLLYELNMVERVRKEGLIQTYRIENKARQSLPSDIILASLLLKRDNYSISFEELINGINSVGSVYAITSDYLMQCISELEDKYPNKIVYSDDAGVQVLQIREGLDLYDVLNAYYEG